MANSQEIDVHWRRYSKVPNRGDDHMPTESVLPESELSAPHVTAVEARMAAIAKAYELLEQLKQLVKRPEYGAGSCPALALELLKDAMSWLDPTDRSVRGGGSGRAAD